MRSTALAICGKASRTEAATLASSRLMMPTRSSVDSRSRRVEARLRCSVRRWPSTVGNAALAS